jgi:hypothetical protein
MAVYGHVILNRKFYLLVECNIPSLLCSITCTGNEEKDTPDKGTSDNDAVKSCGKFSFKTYCM